MLNLNKIFISGRLTANPEIKVTTTNRKVCSFSIANNAAKNITYYFTIIAWEAKADFIVANFRKGSPIFVEGELVQRKYTDKNNKTVSVVEIRALDIKFVETLEEKNARMAGEATAEPAAPAATADEAFIDISNISSEDLPF